MTQSAHFPMTIPFNVGDTTAFVTLYVTAKYGDTIGDSGLRYTDIVSISTKPNWLSRCYSIYWPERGVDNVSALEDKLGLEESLLHSARAEAAEHYHEAV